MSWEKLVPTVLVIAFLTGCGINVHYVFELIAKPLLHHWIICAFVLIPILVKVYLIATTAVCRSKRRLDGKTALVTGANAGIGLETARDFAQRGAKVILGCRNLERATRARDDIVSSTGNQQVEVGIVDLSSIKSVRKFCKEFVNREDRLDILVNNAAMNTAAIDYKQIRMLTEDKLEMHMAANHFGPFLLTNLLLGLMLKTPDSRIVIVSSVAHGFVDLDLDNLNFEKSYTPLYVYSVTKLANMLFALELSQRLKGTGVTCNSLHPGVIATDIYKNYPRFLMPIIRFFSKTTKDGAQTSIYVAVSEDLHQVSGKYFVECKEAKTSNVAQDKIKAVQLWNRCLDLTGLEEDEMFC